MALDRSIGRTAGDLRRGDRGRRQHGGGRDPGPLRLGVPFVGALGLAAAIVVAVTMLSALTLVPAFLGVAAQPGALRPRAAAGAGRRARRIAATARRRRTSTARSPAGAAGQRPARGPGRSASVARAAASSRSRCSRSGSASSTPAPTRPRRADRRAYDLIAQGFGPGANGPLTVVRRPARSSPRARTRSCSTDRQKDARGDAGRGLGRAGRRSTTPARVAVHQRRPEDRAPGRRRPPTLVDTAAHRRAARRCDATDLPRRAPPPGYVDFTERIASADARG